MRLAVVSALVLGTLGLACAQPVATPEEEVQRSSSIVGGTTANLTAWPGMVQLENENGPFCGATLIANEWAMTAAHCLDPSKPLNGINTVVTGRQDSTQNVGDKIPVAEAFRHEAYNETTMENDIALIRLTRSAGSAPKARLATEVEWSRVARTGLGVTVVGWGTTVEGGDMSPILRQVTVPLVSHASCVAAYKVEQLVVGKDMICAGTNQGGQDSCQGDSGGPLFVTLDKVPVQVGVVSFGTGCARAAVPGVYTRLASYRSWLSTKTNGAIGAPATPLEPGTNAPPSTSDQTPSISPSDDTVADGEDTTDDTKPTKRKTAAVVSSSSCSMSTPSSSRRGGAGLAVLIAAISLLGAAARRGRAPRRTA